MERLYGDVDDAQADISEVASCAARAAVEASASAMQLPGSDELEEQHWKRFAIVRTFAVTKAAFARLITDSVQGGVRDRTAPVQVCLHRRCCAHCGNQRCPNAESLQPVSYPDAHNPVRPCHATSSAASSHSQPDCWLHVSPEVVRRSCARVVRRAGWAARVGDHRAAGAAGEQPEWHPGAA